MTLVGPRCVAPPRASGATRVAAQRVHGLPALLLCLLLCLLVAVILELGAVALLSCCQEASPSCGLRLGGGRGPGLGGGELVTQEMPDLGQPVRGEEARRAALLSLTALHPRSQRRR